MATHIPQARGRMNRALLSVLMFGFLVLSTIAAPAARAQDRAVYYDANYGTTWLQENQSQQLRNYFTSIGYQWVDAAGLKTFMQAHVTSKIPSIVIMARDAAPDTVVDVSSGEVVATGNLIVDYMNAGGRVVHLGDVPFYNIALTSGGDLAPQPGPSGAMTILGIPGSDTSTGCTNDSLKPVAITPEGQKEGLTTPWRSQRVIPDSNADTVLAESAEGVAVTGGCAAGWIKDFPSATAPGAGEFIRLYDQVISAPFGDAQLNDIRSVAEYGLVAADTVPPAAITDLAVTNPTSGSVTLTFTAPADTGAGSTGNAAGYEIRYSTQPITAANIGSAMRAAAPTPSKAGARESIPISGLDSLQSYFFAVISHDAAGNASALSNVVQGQTSFVSFPTLPAVIDKAVYFDSNYATSWVGPSDAMQIRDYFVGKGYTLEDANGLAAFMQAHAASQAPSAVILAQDIIPDTVIDLSAGTLGNKNILNDYLNNGGRIIQYGNWPFYNIGLSSGGNNNPQGGGAQAILGFNAAGGTQGIGDPVSLTPIAVALGLKSSWTSVRPANPGDVDVVLAGSRGGAAGWIKFYPSLPGPGFFGRLLDNNVGNTPLTPDQLADAQKLAEASGMVASNPARITGSVLDATGSPAPNATVTLTPVGGGAAIDTTSNAQGIYSVLVSPGSYTLNGKGVLSTGVAGTIGPAGPATAALDKIGAGPTLTLAQTPLPSLPSVTDKAVYYDPNYTTNWIIDTNAQQIRDYFVGAGYALLDGPGLATYMAAHVQSKTPSVVVMSQDIYPDTVIDISSGAVVAKNLLTDYLNAGGRTVNFGDDPFFNIGQSSGGNNQPGPNGSRTILGFDAAGGAQGINDATTITPIGEALGLTSTWNSQRPANPNDVDVVLANAQGGAAGWIKFFPSSSGTGMFIRLVDTPPAGNMLTDAELADAQKLAELTGVFPTVGGVLPGDPLGLGKITIADATKVLQWAVKLGTPTATQKTAGDVNKDGVIDIRDVTLILQAIVNGAGF